MWTISGLKQKAQATLSRGYWKAVLVAFILVFAGGNTNYGSKAASGISSFIMEFAGALTGDSDEFVALLSVGLVIMAFFFVILGVSIAFSLFILSPLVTGCERYFLLSCIQTANVGEMGFAFNKDHYLNIVKITFFKNLYIALWTLLFLIPGIVKSYEYRMIPYLICENPTIDMNEAFRISRKMMDGEKMNAFFLDLSFIGWGILNMFTCGILGIFYITPYKKFTDAELYFALRYKAFEQ